MDNEEKIRFEKFFTEEGRPRGYTKIRDLLVGIEDVYQEQIDKTE